jgi:hypothetical protein
MPLLFCTNVSTSRERPPPPPRPVSSLCCRADPADVSRTVSQAVGAFMQLLSMPPPVQLLAAPRAFVHTLQLAPDKLRAHLELLKCSVSSLKVAQQVARRYTGALLTPSAEQLLVNAKDVGELLALPQVGTVSHSGVEPWVKPQQSSVHTSPRPRVCRPSLVVSAPSSGILCHRVSIPSAVT